LVRPGGYLLFTENFVHGPVQRGPNQVNRPIEEIESLVEAAGLNILHRRPMGVLGNAQVYAPKPWRKTWGGALRAATLTAPTGWLAGALLYPIERTLVRTLSESPTFDLMVCRPPPPASASRPACAWRPAGLATLTWPPPAEAGLYAWFSRESPCPAAPVRRPGSPHAWGSHLEQLKGRGKSATEARSGVLGHAAKGRLGISHRMVTERVEVRGVRLQRGDRPVKRGAHLDRMSRARRAGQRHVPHTRPRSRPHVREQPPVAGVVGRVQDRLAHMPVIRCVEPAAGPDWMMVPAEHHL